MDRPEPLLIAEPPARPAALAASARSYVAPAITPLGTLDQLTLGGTIGPDDGQGGAGATGSI